MVGVCGSRRPVCGRIQFQPSRNAQDAVSIYVHSAARDQDFLVSLAPGRCERPTGQLAFRRIAPHVFELVSVRDSDRVPGPSVAPADSVFTRACDLSSTTALMPAAIPQEMPRLATLADGHDLWRTIRTTLHGVIEDHPLGRRQQAVLRLLLTALPAEAR